MKLLVNGQPKEFALSPDAPIYQRVGDERLAMSQGSWIGGELIDFRADGGAIRMLVYRINFANPAADRYSRLALWQVHKTRQELDTAFGSLKIGELQDMRVIERGPSERPVSTEIVGSTGRRTGCARCGCARCSGLRDSLFSFDIERNARGAILGMTFFGRGWGHGVGMCQVGRLRHGARRRDVRRDPEEVLQRHRAEEAVLIATGARIFRKVCAPTSNPRRWRRCSWVSRRAHRSR